MNREKAIEEILDTVDDWDLDTLVGYAKDTMSECLKKCTDEELRNEHFHQVGEADATTLDEDIYPEGWEPRQEEEEGSQEDDD